MQDLTVEQLSVLAGQKDKTGRHLARLARTAEHRSLAKAFHLLCRSRRWLDRRVHRTRSNGIDADALFHELLRQAPGEGDDGALGRAVIHHATGAPKGDSGRGINDAEGIVSTYSSGKRLGVEEHLRSAFFHVRQGILGQRKHLQDVAAERALHVVQVNLGKVLAHDLLGGIVDQHVEAAVSIDMLLHRLTAGLVVHEIAGDEKALPALAFFDELLGFLCIFLLLG